MPLDRRLHSVVGVVILLGLAGCGSSYSGATRIGSGEIRRFDLESDDRTVVEILNEGPGRVRFTLADPSGATPAVFTDLTIDESITVDFPFGFRRVLIENLSAFDVIARYSFESDGEMFVDSTRSRPADPDP
ncbi:MAG: hypothetical protein ACF8PN_03140 [Phycisphaerales bacterium]